MTIHYRGKTYQIETTATGTTLVYQIRKNGLRYRCNPALTAKILSQGAAEEAELPELTDFERGVLYDMVRRHGWRSISTMAHAMAADLIEEPHDPDCPATDSFGCRCTN